LQVQTLNWLCHKVRITTTSVSPNLNPRLVNAIEGHPEFNSTATGIDPPTDEELSNTTDDQLDNYNITPTIDRRLHIWIYKLLMAKHKHVFAENWKTYNKSPQMTYHRANHCSYASSCQPLSHLLNTMQLAENLPQ